MGSKSSSGQIPSPRHTLPLWLTSLHLPLDLKIQLLESEGRLSHALVHPPIPKHQLPSLNSAILEFSKVFQMMLTPAALWTLPDGFLRLSNSAFTQISPKDMIQHVFKTECLASVYQAFEEAVQSGSANGTVVFVNSGKAAMSLSLRWTREGVLMVGYFISLD
jgi:hypothetical protein